METRTLSPGAPETRRGFFLSASASAGALSIIRAMSLPCGGSALRGRRCGHGVGCCVRLVAQSIINAEGDEGDNNPYEPEGEDVARTLWPVTPPRALVLDTSTGTSSSFVDISILLGVLIGSASGKRIFRTKRTNSIAAAMPDNDPRKVIPGVAHVNGQTAA